MALHPKLPVVFDSVQKVFKVPSTREQMKIPFARVNHAKFMVTDRVVYIGMLSPLRLVPATVVDLNLK